MNYSIGIILKRSSFRTFDGEPLTMEETAAIEQAFRDCSTGPFGGRPRFALAGPAAGGLPATGSVGTYGVIQSAPAYMLGAIARGPFAFEDFGYCMEGVVLAAAGMGLGTCWLGGVFDRGAAARALNATPDEVIPAMSPVGHPKDRRGLVDSVIRASAASSSRKPWDRLFFSGSFDTPLEEGADPWSTVLECVRHGPSASNKQPWRVVRTDEGGSPRFHLFLFEDKTFNHLLGSVRLQNIDMGIAMRHFEAAARALGLPGSWRRLESDPIAGKPPLVYTASWM